MPENRLIHEKSPYLLQHAHNPVDWYPWGEEAFAKARAEEKPIFLSIGYSTCHWCHVMERESFENQGVAELLNTSFVPIKVDREERPDIDAVYMTVCQALTGSGGWPLNLLLTPEQLPFWAGTYLPRRSRYGRPGLIELLKQTAQLWETDREELIRSGETLSRRLRRSEENLSTEPSRRLLREAAESFRRRFDPENGGFGHAPKFPSPQNLLFLMAYSRQEGDEKAMEMAETTLRQMARGGIFDQIGGGFSRYSTDDRWLAPHFEKMLYDNALLAYAYLEAFRCTGEGYYLRIAERTLDYMLRELRSPEGAFFCAQDADSEGQEGAYYLFRPEEVEQLLGAEEARRFCRRYDISSRGNFPGGSIPNLLESADYADEWSELPAQKQKLYEYRRQRMSLHRDDKVLASWNGLAIAALAKAYRLSGKEQYLQAAREAEAFLLREMLDENGRLLLRWRDGEAAHAGQLDDYTFLSWAELELYSADFDPAHLQQAEDWMEQVQRHFRDEENGGFYLTADDGEQLISRPKEVFDGAMPSGNSMAGLVLARLCLLSGEGIWQQRALDQLAFLAGQAEEYPPGYCCALLAMTELLYPSQELVCVSGEEQPPSGLRELAEAHQLHTLFKSPENAAALAQSVPLTADYPLPKEAAAFYLCQGGACRPPVYDLGQLGAML